MERCTSYGVGQGRIVGVGPWDSAVWCTGECKGAVWEVCVRECRGVGSVCVRPVMWGLCVR